MNFLKKLFDKKIEKDSLYDKIILGKIISYGIAIAPIYKAKIDIFSYKSKIEFKNAIDITINELELLYKNSNYNFYLTQSILLRDRDIKLLDNLDDFNIYIKNNIQPLTTPIFNKNRCDYLDIQKRVFSHIGQNSSIIFPKKPSILIADDVLPSDILLFKDNNIIGVILKKASKNSNSSKLLRELNIPTMLIRENIKDTPKALLDASLTGGLIENPTDEEIIYAKNKNLNNIELKDTFIDCSSLLKSDNLSIDEEVKIYKNVFKQSNTINIKSLNIQIFDKDTKRFEQHIKAVLRSSRGLNINLALSMVSTPNEFKDIKNVILNIQKKYNLEDSNIKYGLNIEVPSTIFFIKGFNKVVDFYHIDRESLYKNLFATTEDVNPSSVELSYIIDTHILPSVRLQETIDII